MKKRRKLNKKKNKFKKNNRKSFDFLLEKYNDTKKSSNYLQGKYIEAKGTFGFVEVEGYKRDFLIYKKNKLNAFDGDLVEIEPCKYPKSKGKRIEAVIVNILKRANKKIVGLFQKSFNFGFVIPDANNLSEDIYISQSMMLDAKNNDKVVVEIIFYGDKKRNMEGRIIEILGNMNEKGVDILSAIKEFDVDIIFSDKILKQAENVAKLVSKKDIEFRDDLRNLTTVTIDSQDAKDLDDAISIEKQDDNFILGVHIADVSNYVQERSALDVEALKRGNSIYPVDRVVPMLPTILSNGICSLNEKEDRLTLSCIMIFDKDANLIDYSIKESVINVNAKLNYDMVNAALNKEDADEKTKNLLPMLKLMKKLANKLKQKRIKKGAIDFDFKESKIILDDNNKPVDIIFRQRNIATSIIEEFMLVANETVATHFCKKNIPFIYRVHEKPNNDKVEILQNICKRLNYPIRISKKGISSKQISNLIKRVKGTYCEEIIKRMALKVMQMARYSVECSGHFGLSKEFYCHFTSPIRRYSDLQIHRIIRDYLHNKLNEEKIEHYSNILEKVASTTSNTERKAIDIERKTVKIKKAEYMMNFIGEFFEGVISGVNGRGLFVELINTVEGMISIDRMNDDHYNYDEATLSLIGKNTGKIYTFGDKINIKVINADKYTGNVDFSIAK